VLSFPAAFLPGLTMNSAITLMTAHRTEDTRVWCCPSLLPSNTVDTKVNIQMER
jgi:hypothetical protein